MFKILSQRDISILWISVFFYTQFRYRSVNDLLTLSINIHGKKKQETTKMYICTCYTARFHFHIILRTFIFFAVCKRLISLSFVCWSNSIINFSYIFSLLSESFSYGIIFVYIQCVYVTKLYFLNYWFFVKVERWYFW